MLESYLPEFISMQWLEYFHYFTNSGIHTGGGAFSEERE